MVGGDDGDAIAHEGFDGGGFEFGAEEGDAIHAAKDHAADGVLGAGGVEVSVRDEEFALIFDEESFEDFDEFHEEGVVEVGDDGGVDLAFAVLEVDGGIVGDELEFLDDGADASGGFFGDGRGAVDDAGDGGDGNTGHFGDLAHAGWHKDLVESMKCRIAGKGEKSW